MAFDHACFLSFPNAAGPASVFAQAFYEELQAQISVYDKTLSIFKWDQREERRSGDAWELWIQRELCHSAMMVAVCAPAYFSSSPGCVSEFDGMESLASSRCTALAEPSRKQDWIVGLRLKPQNQVQLPRLNKGYHVIDFADCCASPQQVRRSRQHRTTVENLAGRIFKHWEWLRDHPNRQQLQTANLCATFKLTTGLVATSDPFPHASGVQS